MNREKQTAVKTIPLPKVVKIINYFWYC